MSLTTADLRKRIDAATSGDTVRGVVFNATFGLVRRHEGDEAARACDPLGKGSRSDFMNYDVRDYLEVSYAAARALAPTHGGEDAAFLAIGAATWDALSRGTLGRTLLGLAFGDPRRMEDLFAPGYRAVVGYGERTIAWSGPKAGVARYVRDFMVPEFHCGVIGGILATLGGRDVRVVGRTTGFLEMEFEFSWA